MIVTDVRSWLTALAPSDQSRIGYLFWLSRPRFWFYLAGPVILGVVYAADSTGDLFSPIVLALLLYFLIPANVFLYGVNDRFDVEIDRLNPKKSADGKESQFREDPVVITAIVLATVLGVGFVPFLSLAAIVALAGFFFLGFAYSAPPFRFKTTPFLDSFSNGLYILPGVVAYAHVAGEVPPLLAIVAGWFWTMGMHTFSAIPDVIPDRRAGITTTATVLGRERTLAYCAGCWLAATICMAILHWFFAVVFLVYPVFVSWIVIRSIDVNRAYWWFPIINTLAGMILTLGGIWRLLYV